MRRPFAPSETLPGGFAFVYAVVGTGTEAMTRLCPGETVSVLGPLGNGFAPPPSGAIAILAGGGCGTPSLRPLAEAFAAIGSEVWAVVGAKSGEGLLERDGIGKAAKRLTIATDDGSAGIRGTAVDGARSFLDDAAGRAVVMYACGPGGMMAGLARLAAERGVRCEVSLEERMACGFGACVGCAVEVASGDGFVYKKVCADGPVFDAATVRW